MNLGKLLVERAKKIEAQRAGSSEDPFHIGRQFAFYEVLSLLKQQALAFGLTDSQVGLEGFDVDRLLK